MQSFIAAALIASLFSCSADGNEETCGCIDRSWCSSDPTKYKLDCPLSNKLCTSSPFSAGHSSGLDVALADVSTDCNDGWSTASPKSTDNGLPNPMVGVVQDNLNTDNVHIMYINGNGRSDSAWLFFKSKDGKTNIPMFMVMLLSNKYFLINERKDGRWCSNNIRVNNEFNGKWRMELKVSTPLRDQEVDITYQIQNYDTIFRFYPQTPIKKGDWFIFGQDGHSIQGISWSRIGDVKFKGTPIPGSRIVVHGIFFKPGDEYNVLIKDEKGVEKMKLNGILSTGGWFSSATKNSVIGYDEKVSCSSGDFYKSKFVVIVIEVMEGGIKVYGNGQHLCDFQSAKFKRSDVSQIDVNGALQIFGYGANTCEYYR